MWAFLPTQKKRIDVSPEFYRKSSRTRKSEMTSYGDSEPSGLSTVSSLIKTQSSRNISRPIYSSSKGKCWLAIWGIAVQTDHRNSDLRAISATVDKINHRNLVSSAVWKDKDAETLRGCSALISEAIQRFSVCGPALDRWKLRLMTVCQ